MNDANKTQVIEKSLVETRVRQATDLVSTKDQLIQIDEEVGSQTRKLVDLAVEMIQEAVQACKAENKG